MTGTAGYFDEEITLWMQPEAPPVTSAAALPAAEIVGRAQAVLQVRAPDAERWSLDPSWDRLGHDWYISWSSDGQAQDHIIIDPVTGDQRRPVLLRETAGGVGLYRLHYQLHYMSEHSAILIVGACTMLMLLAILSGIVTHKKIFKDFFTFRPDKGQRSWLDMHNIVSVTALPFFLVMTYSGLIFFMYAYMPAAMNVAYGSDAIWPNDGYSNPLNPRANNSFDGEVEPGKRASIHARAPWASPLTDLSRLVRVAEGEWGQGRIGGISIAHPGRSDSRITFLFMDSGLVYNSRRTLVFDGVTGRNLSPPPFRQGAPWLVQNGMIALHEGLFAGPLLRWFYFLSGLLGCGMIATGLILWTVKRRQKQQRGDGDAFSYRLVEILNIGTIVGLPLGIAAYFLANRLLPVGLAARPAWEYHALFATMGAAFLWATVRRSAGQAWTDLLWIAALAFLSLPLLNAATTNRHLGTSILGGEWVLASFDLTMFAIGTLLGVAAFMVKRGQTGPDLPVRGRRMGPAA
ncbi:PepSY-associated TM helix domain-containing protein [Sphingobium sp. WCS2017Hpa-17]|uniref:PepSY-associated TM helix domain-containing protein n=1 Tax=Sphingobium sp. WCS2017Hpa-17 TaxID=3073638 RepID=UPI002889161A|nr:PepSY-associated TM helix domain-containing protein [Sphingobium sp. WCS2017Hpa-17]